MEKQIIQYIRDERGCPEGVLVALLEDDTVKIGYSVLHLLDKGKFDRKHGLKIAIGRAKAFETRKVRHIPPKVTPYLHAFFDRCSRCFKDKALPIWICKWEGLL